MGRMAGMATGPETLTRVCPIPGRAWRGKYARLASAAGLGVLLIFLGDVAALLAAGALAWGIRLHVLPALWPGLSPQLPPELLRNGALLLLVVLACFVYERLYVRRQAFWREGWVVARALTLSAVIMFAVVGLGRLETEVSRSVLLLWYLFALPLVPAARYLVKPALLRAGLWAEPVLVLGAGQTGALVVRGIDRSPYMGLTVVAVLDDDPAKQAEGITVDGRHYRIQGGFEDAPRLIDSLGIREVIIAAPGVEPRLLVDLANRLQPMVRTVAVVPDLIGMAVATGELTYFFEEGILAYRNRNNLAYPANRALKRAFDVVAGTVALVLASPLMLVIAVAVKVTSPGPVIFSHRRIGLGGREFTCQKFRTMVVNNEEVLAEYLDKNPQAREEWEKFAKLRGHDPRLTPVGGVLRRWSLDELPQLVNVLKGNMSLVGPRPYLPREIAKMGTHLHTMILARPGITGLWQVSGRNDIDFQGRLELESRYIRNWSLWLDFSIMFRTIPAVLRRDGAY